MAEQTKITKSAAPSYTEAIDAGNTHFPQLRIFSNQPPCSQFVNNQESELMLPLKSFRYLSSRQRLIGEKKRDEFFLILTQAFTFLHEMEVQIFNLDSKIPVSSSQLAVLEEEASMIKGMIRKALLQFDEMVKSIQEPFQTSRNSLPESVDERQENGSQNHDKDVLGDIPPVKPCQEVPHGEEDNQ